MGGKNMNMVFKSNRKTKVEVHEHRESINMNLTEMTLPELLQLQIDVEKQIEDVKESAREEALEKMKEVALAAGFEFADLVGAGGGKAKKPKAPAKFQLGDVTWSGRGRKPTAITEWLAEDENRTMDDLLIDQ